MVSIIMTRYQAAFAFDYITQRIIEKRCVYANIWIVDNHLKKRQKIVSERLLTINVQLHRITL